MCVYELPPLRTQEVAGSMAEMQEYMLQMVTARCREGVAEAMAAAQGNRTFFFYGRRAPVV